MFHDPEHPVLLDAARHDYASFAQRELEQRSTLGYPPYGRLCRLVVKSLDETLCADTCEALHHWMGDQRGPVQLLGPGPAPVRQVRREFRYQIVLKSPRQADPGGRLMRALALKARQHFEARLRSKDLSLVIDVDPQSLM
jgi:primosomal protein N' (replication factor Y)